MQFVAFADPRAVHSTHARTRAVPPLSRRRRRPLLEIRPTKEPKHEHRPSSIEDFRRDMGQRHLVPLWELETEIMGPARSPARRRGCGAGTTSTASPPLPVRMGRRTPRRRCGPRCSGSTAGRSRPRIGNLPGGRFIIDGRFQVFLEWGDLVLTPPWMWHDHCGESDERAGWIDALDIPLNNYVDGPSSSPTHTKPTRSTRRCPGPC